MSESSPKPTLQSALLSTGCWWAAHAFRTSLDSAFAASFALHDSSSATGHGVGAFNDYITDKSGTLTTAGGGRGPTLLSTSKQRDPNARCPTSLSALSLARDARRIADRTYTPSHPNATSVPGVDGGLAEGSPADVLTIDDGVTVGRYDGEQSDLGGTLRDLGGDGQHTTMASEVPGRSYTMKSFSMTKLTAIDHDTNPKDFSRATKVMRRTHVGHALTDAEVDWDKVAHEEISKYEDDIEPVDKFEDLFARATPQDWTAALLVKFDQVLPMWAVCCAWAQLAFGRGSVAHLSCELTRAAVYMNLNHAGATQRVLAEITGILEQGLQQEFSAGAADFQDDTSEAFFARHGSSRSQTPRVPRPPSRTGSPSRGLHLTSGGHGSLTSLAATAAADPYAGLPPELQFRVAVLRFCIAHTAAVTADTAPVVAANSKGRSVAATAGLAGAASRTPGSSPRRGKPVSAIAGSAYKKAARNSPFAVQQAAARTVQSLVYDDASGVVAAALLELIPDSIFDGQAHDDEVLPSPWSNTAAAARIALKMLRVHNELMEPPVRAAKDKLKVALARAGNLREVTGILEQLKGDVDALRDKGTELTLELENIANEADSLCCTIATAAFQTLDKCLEIAEQGQRTAIGNDEANDTVATITPIDRSGVATGATTTITEPQAKASVDGSDEEVGDSDGDGDGFESDSSDSNASDSGDEATTKKAKKETKKHKASVSRSEGGEDAATNAAAPARPTRIVLGAGDDLAAHGVPMDNHPTTAAVGRVSVMLPVGPPPVPAEVCEELASRAASLVVLGRCLWAADRRGRASVVLACAREVLSCTQSCLVDAAAVCELLATLGGPIKRAPPPSALLLGYGTVDIRLVRSAYVRCNDVAGGNTKLTAAAFSSTSPSTSTTARIQSKSTLQHTESEDAPKTSDDDEDEDRAAKADTEHAAKMEALGLLDELLSRAWGPDSRAAGEALLPLATARARLTMDAGDSEDQDAVLSAVAAAAAVSYRALGANNRKARVALRRFATLTGRVHAPLAHPSWGVVPLLTHVALTCASPRASIFFSVTGFPVPGQAGTTEYNGPITLDRPGGVVIRCCAMEREGRRSGVVTLRYTVLPT